VSKPSKPVGGGGARHPNSLANLRPGAGAGDSGLQRARSHGAYTQLAADRVSERERAIIAALSSDAPLRDGADELPAHDGAIVTLLAQCLCRLEDVSANLRDFGLFVQRGKRKGHVRPAVELEAKLRREAAGYLDSLGMTPKARAALGVDLARTVDLATAMSEPDPERRGELMRRAGLHQEGDDGDR
jgi:Phage terminase, small subunit